MGLPFDLQASPQLAQHHINLCLGLATRGIIEPAVAGSCERSFAPGDDDATGAPIGSWSPLRERQTRRGVLNWERLSNTKPCSASAYQLNSLVIAAGGDQAAIAPEGGPKYRLFGAGASFARPPEAGADWQSAAGRAANAISPANCRTSSLLDSESSQLLPRARMKVHNSVTSLRSPPQTERPLARSTMLSVSANFMT